MENKSNNFAIKKMFASIATRYDLANDVLTFNIYKRWYKKVIKLSGMQSGSSVLDVACGTGNLAIEFKKAGAGVVYGIDYTPQMLDIAKVKAQNTGLDINFEAGDALHINYPDYTFDFSVISFGIRNVDSVEVCLEEMARIVKPGGKVIILEVGQPNAIINLLYKIYHKVIVQPIGGFITGNRKAYQYLTDTARVFPCRNNFVKIMNETDAFSTAYFKSLFLGIAFIYVGIVK